MSQIARRLHAEPPAQEVGKVVSTGSDGLQVAITGSVHPARRAVSCLLEPERGDLVLVTHVPGHGCYVLAVLEREEGTPGRLVHSGNLDLRLPSGRLTVSASEGLGFVTSKDVTCVSSSLQTSTVEANVSFERGQFFGRIAHVQVETMKVLGRFIDTVVERLSQRVHRSFRRVEGIDHVRSEQLDYVATKNASVRGKNTLVTAEQLVKLDGEQVHLG